MSKLTDKINELASTEEKTVVVKRDDIENELRRIAEEKTVVDETSRIYDILKCNGIIRIDYIITKDADGNDQVNMLEINTTPGMTATSFIPQQVRAAGLDIKDVLTDIVENQFA